MIAVKLAGSIRQRLEAAASAGLSRNAVLKGLKPADAAKQALAALLDEGKALETEGRIYGKAHEPTSKNLSGLLRAALLANPEECLTAAQIKKRVPKPLGSQVGPTLESMVSRKEAVCLTAGKNRFFVHRDAISKWFPSSGKSPQHHDSPALLERVLKSYRVLIETRGGFRTVPISDLGAAAKLEVTELHHLIRGQIQARRANIYRSSSAVTPQSMLDAAMRLNNDPEPYVSVEFYD